MDRPDIDLDAILDRAPIAAAIAGHLAAFEANKDNLLAIRGIYLYGDSGVGKTQFITNLLIRLGYDAVRYDAGDVRNAAAIKDMAKHNMSDRNILAYFNRQVRRIVIVMDDIDDMNSGDKGGINTLIHLIRPKKTKKQRNEATTMNPIICIGNRKVDKKIKELIKVCHTIEMPMPTLAQMTALCERIGVDAGAGAAGAAGGDLRKLALLCRLPTSRSIFHYKSHHDDMKKITAKLLATPYPIEAHQNMINDTDRTSVGLLWHENIIDYIAPDDAGARVYLEQLENICYADYLDRVTFQKQIWQFNEMSSIIKTFKNHRLFHARCPPPRRPAEIRFTKVLTKYSTEYNNAQFIQKMCNKLAMDKNDLIAYFLDAHPGAAELEQYDINRLDIGRMYRYIDKYINENAVGVAEKEVEEDDENEDECEENECEG